MNKTEVGDIVIINDFLPFRIVQLDATGKDKHPYGLLCMITFSIELWSVDGNFKVGDQVFGEDMQITAIIKKKMFEILKKL